MDAPNLFVSQLEVIDRIIHFVCRRYRLAPADVDDFNAIVKLKLIENDYALIRRFEGRSSFATFLTTVIQRLFFEYRMQQWGKWRPSAEARRMGETAIRLEQFLTRDGYSFDEACEKLINDEPAVSKSELERLFTRLPARSSKPTLISLEQEIRNDEIASRQDPSSSALEVLEQSERQDMSVKIGRILEEAIAQLSDEERLIMQYRFWNRLTIPEIAERLGTEQKPLYKRIERILRTLRSTLQKEAIDEREIAEIISAGQFEDSIAIPNVRTIKSADGLGIYVDPGTARRTLRELLGQPRAPGHDREPR